MTSKQARLVAAVSDAKEAQGFTWKQVATMGGVSQGTISSVINSGVTMKDERWKLICEGLGLDYDEIIKPPEIPASSPAGESEEKETAEIRCTPPKQVGIDSEEEREKSVEKLMGITTIKADSESLFLLAMYAEGRLAHDIEAGMKVDPMKLWGILDALRIIKQATI